VTSAREPVDERSLAPGQTALTWAETSERIGAGDTYWLSTVDADGRPHLRPVLAVWVDGALHFCTGPKTRKGRNLARNPQCAVALASEGLDVVLDGTASKVLDEARLRRAADAYATKYDWHVTVRDGAFRDAEGAPTAGPPPYELYEVVLTSVVAHGTDGRFASTRWQF
jgi:nitroimidazol reductase NimA-like FMN-containing flavoprotein (pyridoxamine 5'-phosphate oxidase superfamily)